MKKACKTKKGVWVFDNGQTHFFNKASLVKFLHGATEEESVSEGLLVSPMPGKIFKLLVKKGDIVKKGQDLVVVEAMKMEHSLKAPFDGVIQECYIQESDQVELKQELLLVG